ncbi:MAG TPA: choice-of-anchor D domain-containing protein [Terriglobia bacterium]|nr:choice-of-anchor D domain-containing protein [Terriglobia bacterium]
MSHIRHLAVLILVSFGLTATASPGLARRSFTVGPSQLKFGSQSIKLPSAVKSVTVTNTGSTTVTISSFSISPSEFEITGGTAPNVLLPGNATGYRVVFAPDQPQAFSGALTLTISGDPSPVVVPLSGTGISTSAIAQVAPASLAYGNLAVGSTSSSQTVTVTNAGTTALTVKSVDSSSLAFTISGFGPNSVTLQGGESTCFTVNFSPAATNSYTGTIKIVYDVLPASGVSMTGAGVPPISLAISTLSALPAATQFSAYLATLTGAGGVGPFVWGLEPGSTLPDGLTLSASGVISGTLGSVGVGTYTFTIGVVDFGLGIEVTKQFALAVDRQTGANCNNISWNIAGTTNPLVALNDLGTGNYFGVIGGLYAHGGNVRPKKHDQSGVAIADAIQPLDSNGNPDPVNGKEVLLSLGISTAQKSFGTFVDYASADPLKNSHVVIVNGAQAGESLSLISQSTSPYWTTIFNYLLPNAGADANQVVAAWVEDIDPQPTGMFPADVTGLETEYITLAQVLHNFFPNLQLAYFGSRIYAGYSNGVSTADPEPYAYESAFAVRSTILDQLDGDPALNFDPTLGPVKAPWLSWGSYYWSNGMLGRSDGLVWTCQDVESDGYHPSDPSGRTKVTDTLLNFFKTDDTTTPWFLAH